MALVQIEQDKTCLRHKSWHGSGRGVTKIPSQGFNEELLARWMLREGESVSFRDTVLRECTLPVRPPTRMQYCELRRLWKEYLKLGGNGSRSIEEELEGVLRDGTDQNSYMVYIKFSINKITFYKTKNKYWNGKGSIHWQLIQYIVFPICTDIY